MRAEFNDIIISSIALSTLSASNAQKTLCRPAAGENLQAPSKRQRRKERLTKFHFCRFLLCSKAKGLLSVRERLRQQKQGNKLRPRVLLN